jgi:cellulose synthase/poly-beta-1,6-N-acetylglucosamine synthase-like glycosyltransferase/tetratricopeptide (TPR) repeat protein
VIADLVISVYLVILLALAAFGLHRSQLVYLHYKHRRHRPCAAGAFAEPPAVTVQLPLFNEMYVAARLLEAVARIRYPRDRYQVQVLDDSDDETQEICRRKIAELRKRCPDLDVEYIHRDDRSDFKAGALGNGLRSAKGELILIFDADFLPPADILERTVKHFGDPKVAMVQCRWGHLNRDCSWLTEVQALMLDGHFVMEHGGRSRSGRFFNFNGTAGIWRRAAIVDAGGWEHDTLTEDLDLSYRAQLRGWSFVYLPEIEVPGELPVEMPAFKAQQFRWAKGSTQVAQKLLPRILRSNATLAQKTGALFHLTGNVAYPLLLLLSLTLLPHLALRTAHGILDVLLIDLPLLFATTLSIAPFYLLSEREIALLHGRPPGSVSVWGVLKRLLLLMALGIGLCVSQSRAVLEALLGRETEFVRTPKHGLRGGLEVRTRKNYRAAGSVTSFIELALAACFLAAMMIAFRHGHYLTMPFLALFMFGFGYVGALSLGQGLLGPALRRLRVRKAEPAALPVLLRAPPTGRGRVPSPVHSALVVFAALAFAGLVLKSTIAAEPQEALALLEEARIAAEQESQPMLKVSALGRLAVLYGRMGRRANAEQVLERALAEARHKGDLALEAVVVQRRAEIGDAAGALVAARSLAGAVRNQADLAARAHAMNALAKAYWAAGRAEEARTLISALSVLLAPAPEDTPELKAVKSISVARLRDAQLYCGQLEQIVLTENPRLRPTVLVEVAARYAGAGTYDRAHELARQIPQPEWKAAALLAIARAKAREGMAREGEALAKEAYQAASAELHDNDNSARQFRLVIDFGRTFGKLGLKREALQLLEEARRYAETATRSLLRVELRHVVVRAYADAGEIDRAISLARLIPDDYARADALASVVAALLGCRDAPCG